MASKSFVTSSELAGLFKVSPEWIRRLTKEGMPQEGRGRYDFVSASLWYIHTLQAANKRRTEVGDVGGADTLKREKARILEIETEMKQIDLAKRRRELMPVTDVQRMFDEVIGSLRNRLMAGASRAAIKMAVPKTQAQAQAIVEDVVNEAITAAAREWTNGGKPR